MDAAGSSSVDKWLLLCQQGCGSRGCASSQLSAREGGSSLPMRPARFCLTGLFCLICTPSSPPNHGRMGDPAWQTALVGLVRQTEWRWVGPKLMPKIGWGENDQALYHLIPSTVPLSPRSGPGQESTFGSRTAIGDYIRPLSLPGDKPELLSIKPTFLSRSGSPRCRFESDVSAVPGGAHTTLSPGQGRSNSQESQHLRLWRPGGHGGDFRCVSPTDVRRQPCDRMSSVPLTDGQ